MEPNQEEQRVAANSEFIQSLNQLEDILQQNPPAEKEVPLVENQPEEIAEAEPDDKIDLAAWEDAVADIEQYLEGKTSA
jgi:predicted  nucleic acid-binding Zn-ribbon protein